MEALSKLRTILDRRNDAVVSLAPRERSGDIVLSEKSIIDALRFEDESGPMPFDYGEKVHSFLGAHGLVKYRGYRKPLLTPFGEAVLTESVQS